MESRLPNAEDDEIEAEIRSAAEARALTLVKTAEAWVTFYDPGNGDQTQPLGPFANILMVDNHLIHCPKDLDQPLAEGEKADRLIACYEMNAPAGQEKDWRKHRGWHLQKTHWDQSGLASGPDRVQGLLFPQFRIEFRLPPKQRRFTVKVREVHEVVYEIMCKDAQDAQRLVEIRQAGRGTHAEVEQVDEVEDEVVEHVIGSIEETTEMPDEDPAREDSEDDESADEED